MVGRRMANIHTKWGIIVIFLAGLICAPTVAQSIDVLIVHSYHEGFDWVDGINASIVEHFRHTNISYQFEYMDTKRHPDDAWKVASGNRAKTLLEKVKPAVVIAVDDNAQTYFAKDYAGHSEIQFIFCGVNADPELYGYPAANIAGILERTYMDQSLELLHMINPSWDTVAWVSDDSSTAQGVLTRMQTFNAAGRLPVPVVAVSQPKNFTEWKNIILAHEKDPGIKALLIPLYHTVKNGQTGRSILPAKIMQWTTANTSKPIVGLWPFSTQDGALCAVVVDPHEHGRMAALMARQILAGKTAAELPMVTNRSGYVVINLQRAAATDTKVPFEILQTADKIIE